MVLWEGSSWLILLIAGGLSLIALILREKGRTRKLREFFASFSHEIKTSLASLRLQAEALADDLGESPVMNRLVGDTVRLQVQLENTLFLSSQDGLSLFMENLSFARLIERTREQWPSLKIELTGQAEIHADERAVRTILNNICKNALTHGRAAVMRVHVTSAEGGVVRATFADDGQGYSGPRAALGQLFHRPRPTSGSGLGLYISSLLAKEMGGELKLPETARGFRLAVTFRTGTR